MLAKYGLHGTIEVVSVACGVVSDNRQIVGNVDQFKRWRKASKKLAAIATEFEGKLLDLPMRQEES